MLNNGERGWNGRMAGDGGGRLRKAVLLVLLGLLFIYLFVFVPLPYYIYLPGSADEIRPMVQVGKGVPDEEGEFLLTTVGVLNANAVSLVWARLTGMEVRAKENVFHGGTEEEYNQAQVYYMLSSQSSAIQAAYHKLGIKYHMKTEGIMVMELVPGLPAEKVLQVGDYLLKVDGKPLESAEQLIQYLSGKKVGDAVDITFKRGEEVRTEAIALAYLPRDPEESPAPSGEAPRPAIGIRPAAMQEVRADEPERQATIRAEDIGGPSAGLMFTLEIINQLTPDNIAKGYRIAGTGTIDPEGHVGPIGGIRHKVVAADREDADFFFAPKDLPPEPGQTVSPVANFSEAKKQAAEMGTDMKIVPVATLDDALEFLRTLPPKAAAHR